MGVRHSAGDAPCYWENSNDKGGLGRVLEAGRGTAQSDGAPGADLTCRHWVPPKLHRGLQISALWAACNVPQTLDKTLPRNPSSPPKSPQ